MEKQKFKKIGGLTSPFSPDHEQVLVEYSNGEMIHVDKNMKDILIRIWKLNIETVLSCENKGNKGKFYISFKLDQYQHFINLLKSRNERLYKLIYEPPNCCAHLQALSKTDNIKWQVMLKIPCYRMTRIIEEWDRTF